ncbi:ABC-three component system middle component 6 [Erwinia sp. S59]|uniref:ABC-three component system middle component 6 n=1 Tax=Erwinia sp. S59 TaxID=2769340 RepID=UPI00336BD692
MILPSKNIKPVDSLICIGAYVADIIKEAGHISFDELLSKLNDVYPKRINSEHLALTINFLYMLGRVGLKDDQIITIN